MAQKQVLELHLLSIRESARAFLVSMRASSRYSQGYLDNLESSLAFLANFAEERSWPTIDSLAVEQVEEYFAALQDRPRWFDAKIGGGKPLSKTYIETQHRRLKRFFNWLVARGHVTVNPLDAIPPPKPDERVIPTIPQSDIVNLLRLLDPAIYTTWCGQFRAIRDRAVVLLMWDTPSRKGEIVGMTIKSVDLDQRAVLVMGKGRKERWMPIDDVVCAALARWFEVRQEVATETPVLWLSTEGKPMNPNWLYLMLKRVGKRAGIDNLHTHRFRHSYAINALSSGMPEPILRINGGWKDIPPTYLRTLSYKNVEPFHRSMSPAGMLNKTIRQRSNSGQPRGSL